MGFEVPSRADAQVEGDRDLSWLAVGEIVPSPLLWNAEKGNMAAWHER
jgi:hypothetical protein